MNYGEKWRFKARDQSQKLTGKFQDLNARLTG